MVSLRTKTSVRVPSFSGPMALAAGLLVVACFSEPYWQNFYILEANSLNVTMKAGAYGLCTRLRNTTGFYGPSEFCTSTTTGYTLNFVLNDTGINQFPTVQDDATLFGLNSAGTAVPILSSASTSMLVLHIVSAVVTTVCVLSLILPPSYLGSPTSTLYMLQKSGVATVALGLAAFILTFVTFAIDLAVIIPARARLNAIPGIDASLGNLQWFALPAFLVMIPALASVLMKSSINEYADL